MRTDDPRYGDYLIDTAIKAGKFSASRRNHYRRLFAQDANGTIALLEKLEPALAASADLPHSDGLPGSWFPELGRGYAAPTVGEAAAPTVAAAPASPAANGEGLPEQWFPEVRERRAVAAAVEGRGQVLHAHDA